MAPAYMTAKFETSCGFKSRRTREVMYSVTVEDFDGDSYDFEISAESHDDAARQAELLAADQGCYNILNMFIYSL